MHLNWEQARIYIAIECADNTPQWHQRQILWWVACGAVWTGLKIWVKSAYFRSLTCRNNIILDYHGVWWTDAVSFTHGLVCRWWCVNGHVTLVLGKEPANPPPRLYRCSIYGIHARCFHFSDASTDTNLSPTISYIEITALSMGVQRVGGRSCIKVTCVARGKLRP